MENPEQGEMQKSNEDKEEEDYRKSRKNRIITSSCTVCCHLSFMIATIIVLLADRSSCTYPVRAWLIVYIVLSLFGTFTSLLIEILIHKKHLKKIMIQKLYSLYYLVLILFFIAWTILGSVWVYKDDDCKEDFRIGWNLIVAILAVNYGIFIMCSFGGCVGVIYVVAINYMKKVGSGNKLNEEELEINNK